jgi:hypothetical protein
MTSTIEATPDQLARIATLEPRARWIFLEVVALSEEIIALREAGLETREAAESVAGVDDDALDELRTLRVSRGIPAFSDWWFQRVMVLREIANDVPDDDHSAEAEIYRFRDGEALAVDDAIAKVDPELIRLLDRAADRPIGHALDDFNLEAAIGMTEAELQDRAEVVLTQLIDSGWRP